jgi:hypothetical protein
MVRTIQGIMHGKTIELTEHLGFADGEPVEVTVKTAFPRPGWGDGLRRCAGVLAKEWTTDDDRILAEIHQDRKLDARRDVAE